MKNMTKKLFLLLGLSLLCFLVPPAGTCLAAQPDTVTIPISDYQMLKQEYLMLQQNNEILAKLSEKLKEQLRQSQTQQNSSTQDWLLLRIQLTEAQEKAKLLQKQSEMLQEQLTSALQSSRTAELGLQDANKSLFELSKAIKSERESADRREFFLKLLAGAALAVGLSK